MDTADPRPRDTGQDAPRQPEPDATVPPRGP